MTVKTNAKATVSAKTVATATEDTTETKIVTLSHAIAMLGKAEEAAKELESAALTATYAIVHSCAEMIVRRWLYGHKTTPESVWSEIWTITLKTMVSMGLPAHRGEEASRLAALAAKGTDKNRKQALEDYFNASFKDVTEGLAKVRKVARPAFIALATNEAEGLTNAGKLGTEAKQREAIVRLFLNRWGAKGKGGKLGLSYAQLESALTKGGKGKGGKVTPEEYVANFKAKTLPKFGDVKLLQEMRDAIEFRIRELGGAIAKAESIVNGESKPKAAKPKADKLAKANANAPKAAQPETMAEAA